MEIGTRKYATIVIDK